MKPNESSILVDLDNTVYDMTASWEEAVQKVYPELECDYHPITEKLIKISVLQGCASLSRVYDTGFYLDEKSHESALDTLRSLQKQGHDVWFVTEGLGGQHASLSEYEKRVELLRDFGTYGSSVVFSGRKWEVPGRFLIDDHPELIDHQQHGSWSGITVRQVYNIDCECDKWVETHDFQKLLQYLE